jgi:hypothetical protein
MLNVTSYFYNASVNDNWTKGGKCKGQGRGSMARSDSFQKTPNPGNKKNSAINFEFVRRSCTPTLWQPYQTHSLTAAAAKITAKSSGMHSKRFVMTC